MKHITYAEKTLLLGDAAADALLAYAAALGTAGKADTVEVNAVSGDGDDVIATFLIGAGAPLMAETSTTHMPEPDNDERVVQMQQRTRMLQQPDSAEYDTAQPDASAHEDYDSSLG